MKAPRLCFVTACRSEYGLLRWLMEGVRRSDDFVFQLIATGAHLSESYGLTVREIEGDGFRIDERVEMNLVDDSPKGIACSMAECARGFCLAFDRLKPDFLVALGDRYELLPICSTALVMGIPIIHISGGDVTEGAIDNEVRNAVSMMASYHFPGCANSGDRLVSMGMPRERVFVVGEPGLDNFRRIAPMRRDELADGFGIDPGKRWILLTYHPETKVPLERNLETVRAVLECLVRQTDGIIVATYANSDVGGTRINETLEQAAAMDPARIRVVKSMGQRKYMSFLRECAMIAGNSSSGIVEAPMLGLPVLNVGKRQAGRHLCPNVVSCDTDRRSIEEGLARIAAAGFKRTEPDSYFGDGHSSDRMLERFRAICGTAPE